MKALPMQSSAQQNIVIQSRNLSLSNTNSNLMKSLKNNNVKVLKDDENEVEAPLN